MFTHFARADEYDRSPAMVQLERYLDFSRRVEEAGVEIPLHHCSNSAGIIRMPEANLNIVAPESQFMEFILLLRWREIL